MACVKPSFAASFSRVADMRDGANRAGKADLAEEDAMRRQALPGERRDKRRGGGEIGGRLVDAQAARDIEIDVVLAEPQSGARFEHGDDHGEPVLIPADDGAARHAERDWARQAPGFR